MYSNVRRFASAVAFFAAILGWSVPSDAGIQKIVVDQTATVMFSPIPLGSSVPGAPTSYTVYQGRISAHLTRKIPTTPLLPTSTLHLRRAARLTTLRTFKLSHRRIRARAAGS